MRRLSPAFLLLAVPALMAAMPKAQRPLPALIRFEGAPPVIGLVEVHAPEDVSQRAPNDFANMTGMIATAADAFVNRSGSPVQFKDYTTLGYKEADFQRPTRTDAVLPWEVKGVPGVPAGAESPLVLAVQVVEWGFNQKKAADGKTMLPEARVGLVMSTWTRDGTTEVDTRYVAANILASGAGGLGDRDLVARPAFGSGPTALGVFEPFETRWYSLADGRKRFDSVPSKRDELFKLAVNTAVGVYFMPYQAHVVEDNLDVRPGKVQKEALDKTKAGDWAGAQTDFEALSAANPTDEVLPFDAAMCHWALGDVDGAIDWLKKSIAVKSSPLSQGELSAFERQRDIIRTVTLK